MTEHNLNGQSLDIVAENVKKLRQLFPEIVTEDKIDFARLQDILGKYIEPSEESYRFTWYGKSKAFKKSQMPSTGTLRPCKEESKDWDTTQNLYIEGDNLEVLKLLQKSYGGKVKMIYIDPPYNKDKDFVYPDKWSDSIEGYKRITGQIDDNGNATTSAEEIEGGRHTKWLNMIYPRLRLARNLLTDDGVICVQIDDDEFENLKKLCNEIFGEENIIATICVKMSHLSGMKMSHKSKKVPKIKEFILIYAKSKDNTLINPVFIKGEWDEVFDRYLSYVDKSDIDCSNWKISKLSEVLKERGIEFDKDKKDKFRIENASNIFRTAVNDSMLHIPKDNLFHKVTTKTGLEKYAYNSEEVLFANNKLEVIDGKLSPAETVGDIWTDIGINNLHKEGEINFQNGKKPLKLLERLIRMFSNEGDMLVDFFSGSATTAHAVMKLNSEDGGHRRFIMVQLQENLEFLKNKTDSQGKKDIATVINFLDDLGKPHLLSELGKERIRRAGEKIRAELQTKYDAHKQKKATVLDEEEYTSMNPDDLDIGFKVFKLDSSNLNRWALDIDENFHKLEKNEQHAILSEKLGVFINNFVQGRSDLDMVYEVMLKYGIDLTLPIAEYDFREYANEKESKLYSIGDGTLFACFADDLDESLAEFIVEKVKELEPATVRVVVKDLSFATDPDKTNFRETLKTGIDTYFANANNKANKVELFDFITI